MKFVPGLLTVIAVTPPPRSSTAKVASSPLFPVPDEFAVVTSLK